MVGLFPQIRDLINLRRTSAPFTRRYEVDFLLKKISELSARQVARGYLRLVRKLEGIARLKARRIVDGQLEQLAIGGERRKQPEAVLEVERRHGHPVTRQHALRNE